MKIKLDIGICFISIVLLSTSCNSSNSFSNQLGSIVKPYEFSIAGWEFRTILGDIKSPEKTIKVADEPATVLLYFSITQQIGSLNLQTEQNSSNGQEASTTLQTELDNLEAQKTQLEGTVERILTEQITGILAEQGIYNPLDKYISLKIDFPSLYFKLEEPPNLLVISPRDRIYRLKDILLQQRMSLHEEENVETKTSGLGVSSLVVPLGGIATYPSFVNDDSSLQFAITVITHEWVHQYLTFTPLGFLYLLNVAGIHQNEEAATIDETVADMVGNEIGAKVYHKYYPAQENGDGQSANPEPDFFNQTMRVTRQNVDDYLAHGQIDKAEQYMEVQREYLASKGYYIRKLNQAYFAFYGTYADSPISINPVGTELKGLRSKSTSLKEFLDTVSHITGNQTLQTALRDAQ